jgi:geranylgeranylglycerol-phosphate geranylgeranyltransferase
VKDGAAASPAAGAWSRAGRLRAHVQTWRPYTLWYIGLVGLAGCGLASPRPVWWHLADAWAAPTLGWIGAHYLGDYFDRQLDAMAKPHRPIPSGRLTPAAAVACGLCCLAGVGLLAAATGWATGLVAVAAAAGAVGYSRWLKAHGLAGNLIRGALGALALCYGALAAGPAPSIGWPFLPFVLAFWAHDTASNLVGTMRDVAGDRAGGYQTMPVRHGRKAAGRTALLLYAAALLASLLGALAQAGRAGSAAARFSVLLLAAAVLGAAAFWILFGRRGQADARAALRAHEMLVLERLVFAAGPISLGLGLPTAVAVLVPALTLSGWAQARMRSAYELGPATAHREPLADSAPGRLGLRPGPAHKPGID